MIKGFMVFLVTWILLYVGIEGFKSLTGSQKLSTLKSVSYSALIAGFVVGVLFLIVNIF